MKHNESCRCSICNICPLIDKVPIRILKNKAGEYVCDICNQEQQALEEDLLTDQQLESLDDKRSLSEWLVSTNNQDANEG